MTLYLGIDLGTQSLKAVLLDATRVVLPSAGGELCPEHVLEADSASVSVREPAAFCVTTNHFLAHAPGRDPGLDSTERYDKICATIERLRADGDHKVSIDEAWQALASVQRSGRGFGTLHSLVFRHAPWHFELALGEPNGAAKVKGAPGTRRRWVIPRELLFR